jgi:hypothetical protein
MGPATERIPDRAIDVDADGRMSYQSASASGRVPVELPALPGNPTATETVHVADFGAFAAERIQRALTRQPYLQSGPQLSPAATFRHFIGCAAGLGIMADGVIGRMEVLAREFEQEDQREYFESVLRPYLLSLSPKRR